MSKTTLSSFKKERKALKDSRRVVVKVGTAVVINSDGKLALSRMGGLVEQLKELKKSGRDVLLVSSGAVGLGRSILGLSRDVVSDPANVIDRQACAAAGQETLMSTYTSMFSALGLKCAQVLITQHDFSSPQRYRYLTDTLEKLAAIGVIPVINENDAVTGCRELDKEMCFSDNDMLSALVAGGVGADAVAMMTDVDGVFTKPPGEEGAERIKVYQDSASVEIGQKSSMGRGGMASKINAALTATAGGSKAIIANGHDLTNISGIFEGKDIGTLFPANDRKHDKMNYWLAHAATCEGAMTLRSSSVQELSRQASMQTPILLKDILRVQGDFRASSPVFLVDERGGRIGRGIVQFDSCEIEQNLERKLGTVASMNDIVKGGQLVLQHQQFM
ncbi:hypothetical protein GUITHDRAFT_73277 [Guillardia theta CCMP2712]|uniref:Uncharacterized protein n=2 Tax=Guillardia theta TaxID=55529 RepID=L1J5E0_GUITC|nr:hypothetical protein GUITHDRAFT_73277 [Guillardia theta CCMP2712]EKX43319.1 hypothetical protein GUITHDRAFT_73277 [Guillardia theta CCMP2712]|eukprot:XP_005830299.1 hypothetical protein GUITHDRAFT_73277 [Guillardia theta CCMP2712]